MKCEEYRNIVAAIPSRPFFDDAGHAGRCSPCRKFRHEIRQLDTRIAAALAIEVPPLRLPELPPISSTAPAYVVDLRSRRPGKAALPTWFGLAAVLAVATFLGTRYLVPDGTVPSLASQVIAHMDHEQDSRQITSAAVSEQALSNVIGSEVSAMDIGGALVTYARSCVINNETVPHLVIQGQSGPVTLILMPEETIDAAVNLAGQNIHGVIVPVGGGSVAIIGDRTDQLVEIEEIARRLGKTVKWQT